MHDAQAPAQPASVAAAACAAWATDLRALLAAGRDGADRADDAHDERQHGRPCAGPTARRRRAAASITAAASWVGATARSTWPTESAECGRPVTTGPAAAVATAAQRHSTAAISMRLTIRGRRRAAPLARLTGVARRRGTGGAAGPRAAGAAGRRGAAGGGGASGEPTWKPLTIASVASPAATDTCGAGGHRERHQVPVGARRSR